MPLKIDITKDVLYKRGMEKGMQKGMEIAIEKGVKEEKEKLHDIALQLKKKGFSAEEVAEITGLFVSAIAKP